MVAVAGGFDPIHIGHVRHLREAARLGDCLIVILARDDQLMMKKGFVFMPYAERKEILESVVGVKEVMENIDPDTRCIQSLRRYRPDIFAKGGETWNGANLPELEVCQELGIRVIFGVGGEKKVQSSRRLVKKAVV